MAFAGEVCDALGYYVYRLIDPRDGSTFYIGKGKDNRVFSHIQDALALKEDEDEESEKLRTIRQIRNAGLEVVHVIHRHKMTEDEAFAVEAALIDATPGLTNAVGGKYSTEFGPSHASQLIERYSAPTMEVDPAHNLMLININQSVEEKSVLEAVRYAWVVSIERAKQADYVLAMKKGICLDVFTPKEWLRATTQNFKGLAADEPKRWGFNGEVAPEDVRARYMRKRLPEHMMPKKGSRAPVRYFYSKGEV